MGTCYEENDKNISKLTLLSVTVFIHCGLLCVTNQLKFQGLKSISIYYYPPVDRPAGRSCGLEPGGASPVCVCWCLRIQLAVLAGLWEAHSLVRPLIYSRYEWAMRLTTQQARLTFNPMAVGFLECQGEHVPMGSTFQTSLVSRLLLSCCPRQVTFQARVSIQEVVTPRLGYKSDAGINTIPATAHQANS